MKEWNIRALTALKGDLKSKVLVESGLSDILEIDAGGFMTREEAQLVGTHKPNNAKQMEELISILQGKSNATFVTFCQMLRKVGYDAWANEVEKKAREFKGDSGICVLK